MILLIALGGIGVVLFLFLSFKLALLVFIPVAVVFLALGVAMRRQMTRTMRLPVATGMEGMVGRTAEVARIERRVTLPRYVVRCEGELWRARSRDELSVGDEVKIMAAEGITLVVERI